jgi:hypothetical protein
MWLVTVRLLLLLGQLPLAVLLMAKMCVCVCELSVFLYGSGVV